MEPQEPAKNDESSGFSKRRISSILKAPRKSAKFPDQEQQEYKVQCAKPVEKKGSRRVSFAPANDVLLFSKDVKSASPSRSPLQELIAATAAHPENRVQGVVAEDGIRPIVGMETLLNAPLHASQQRNKVNFTNGEDCGEKTIMFATDDAFMDMTHSQTVNIGSDVELPADISLRDYDVLLHKEERTMAFATDERSMDITLSNMIDTIDGSAALPAFKSVDLNVEKKTLSSSLPFLSSEFENFLASLSKSNGSSVNVVSTENTTDGASSESTKSSMAQDKTQLAGVDKENQFPSSGVTLLEKSLLPKKTGQLYNESAPFSEDKSSINITEAQIGVLGSSDDDVFQCLFPTQEMYSQSDKTPQMTVMKSKLQQSSIMLGSSDPKDMTSMKNPFLHASHEKHKVNIYECREKTKMFTEEEFINITKSGTGNITGPPLASQQMSMESWNPGFKTFLASFSKPSPSVNSVMMPTAGVLSEETNTDCSLSQFNTPRTDVVREYQLLNTTRSSGKSAVGSAISAENDLGMEMAETPFAHFLGSTGSDDVFQCIFPSQDMYLRCESAKKSETTSGQRNKQTSSDCKAIESLRPSFKPDMGQRHKIKLDDEDDCSEKTVRFTASHAAMDVTRCHTANIAIDFELQSCQKQNSLSCGEKTVRFTASDAAMDVTQCHTAKIVTDFELQSNQNVDFLSTSGEKTVRFTASDAAMDVTQCHTAKIVTDFELQSNQNVDFLSNSGEKTVRFTAGDAAMDVTQCHTAKITTDFELQSNQNVDFLSNSGEKTVRFTASDAAMDVTQCHTAKITTDFELQSCQKLNSLSCGDKTVRFTAGDAAMDVTQCHTAKITTDFELQSNQNVDFLSNSGEKTVRFTASDAAMDVTQCHTAKIVTDFELQSCNTLNSLSCGEKTVRFTAGDAAMDVTQCHTVNIPSDCDPQSCNTLNSLSCGEKTVRFTASDAAMDVTRCHTAKITTDFELQSNQNVDFLSTTGEKTARFAAPRHLTQNHTVSISSSLLSDSGLLCQDSNIISHRNTDLPLTVKTEGGLLRNRCSSANTLDLGFKNSVSKFNELSHNPVVIKPAAIDEVSPQECVNTNSSLDLGKIKKHNVNAENITPGSVSCATEKPRNETRTDCSENEVNIDKTETQTGCILGKTCTDELSQCLFSKQNLYSNSDQINKLEASLKQKSETLVPSDPDYVEITNHPDCIDANQTESRNIRNETCPTLETMGSCFSGADNDGNTCKSRRISLANLQSKIKRLSTIINTAPDTATVAMDSGTVPLPQLDHDITSSLPVVEPELEEGLVNTEDKTQAQCLTEGQQASVATPFNLKTKQLISRLSVGAFKPKLPQRGNPDDPKKVNSMGEHTKTITVNVTSQLSNHDNNVSDIYDEELGSYEDMSETLDTRCPQQMTGNFHDFNMDEPLEDYVFEEDFIRAMHGQKRPLPEDENKMEDEKRIKPTIEMTANIVEKDLKSSVLECEGNITTAQSLTTQTTNGSDISHTASSRCEATFESTFKHSLFESQLEDYANDGQKKLDDGTITVSEFFKLFNIDFVIHNPRQSVLSGRLLSDRTAMDLLKDRHIHRPKQIVYETDVLNLTEKVDGLKFRMQDLDKPLRLINRPLWEEMRNSSEKQVKSFGAKLKERYNFFRKMGKTQSHEMKEVLYSNVVQANLKEQEKLSGTIGKADEMIQSLDDCISDLERELAAEEKGFDGKPSLKSRLEDLDKVTKALADNERQMCELEMQKKQNSSHLNRLKAETKDLESHIAMLHTVNEWKLGDNNNNGTIYTFLYDVMNLQLVYENFSGNEAANGSEQKVSQITFTFQLDDEKSKCHARLIHKLLSQYFNKETAWLEMCPTSRHVPKLLHDVSLVVSRCRLLGEELRLLKMWGGLRLDIVDIRCVDTKVCIVFSSLKKFSKFEVVFSVSLINQLYVLQLQSFKNKIGGTTLEQLEEIVSSFTPGKKLLTKIVKKIHNDLLR